MQEPSRCVPLIFDYVDLRLRMPVRKADDLLMREAGIALPISRVLQGMLYDHIDLRVGDLEKCRHFYDGVMSAMGCPVARGDEENMTWYPERDEKSRPFFGIVLDREHQANGCRIAFRAESRDEVDRIAEAARASGAAAFEAPHLCEEYSPQYYAAFFEDPEGNKLEVCYRSLP